MGKVVTSDKVLVGDDFNGHVVSDMFGFGEFHGGFGIGQINDGGITLLDWAVGKGLHLTSTCFQKQRSWLVKFRPGEIETMIDYILVQNKYRSNPRWRDGELTLCSVNGYGVQKEDQEESNIQEEIETVEVERVRGERRICWRGQ